MGIYLDTIIYSFSFWFSFSICDLCDDVLLKIIDFSFTLEGVDDLADVFSGRVALSNHIDTLIRKNFFKCTEESALSMIERRLGGYYGHPYRFGILATSLRYLGLLHQIRSHALVRGVPSMMEGEYILQIYGNRLRLLDWVPTVDLSKMRMN